MVLKKSSRNKQIRISKKSSPQSPKVAGYYGIILFLMLVLTDRLTKIWASTSGDKDHGIIAFTYTINTGAGFSILKDMNALLAVISIIAIIAMIYFRKDIPGLSAVMILSGITGNLIDRVFYGGVIDFINLRFWPIFNVADSLIVLGVCFWMIKILFGNHINNNSRKDKR